MMVRKNRLAASLANRLAFALAGLWVRNREAKPHLFARQVGARVDISFVVEDELDMAAVSNRIAELAAELERLEHV